MQLSTVVACCILLLSRVCPPPAIRALPEPYDRLTLNAARSSDPEKLVDSLVQRQNLIQRQHDVREPRGRI